MAEKLWDEMSVDEKLEWLRAALESLADTGNRNNDRLNARDAIPEPDSPGGD
jgi:hypothetical protein